MGIAYTYERGELSSLAKTIILKDDGDPNGEFDDIIEFEEYINVENLQNYINQYRQKYNELHEINVNINWTNEECYKIIQQFLRENNYKDTFNILYKPIEIYY